MSAMHPVLRAAQCSNYSTLQGANGLVTITLGAIRDKENQDPRREFYRRIPTMALTPTPGRNLYWRRGIVIDFQSTNPMDGGLRFSDIKMGRHLNLAYSEGPAIYDGSPATAEFRILWPGYAHLDYNVRLNLVTKCGPVSRWHLAEQIFRAYDTFIDQACRAHYTLADPTWKITSAFNLDDLVLVALTNTDGHDAVFQAQVDVIRRR